MTWSNIWYIQYFPCSTCQCCTHDPLYVIWFLWYEIAWLQYISMNYRCDYYILYQMKPNTKLLVHKYNLITALTVISRFICSLLCFFMSMPFSFVIDLKRSFLTSRRNEKIWNRRWDKYIIKSQPLNLLGF